MQDRWDLNPCVMCGEFIDGEDETIYLPGTLSGPVPKYPSHIWHFQPKEEEEELVTTD